MPAVVPPSLEEEEEVRHTTVSALVQRRTTVCLSVVQELHSTTLHNTALHYIMVFYNQVFVKQTFILVSRRLDGGHTDWFLFKYMDLYGATVNSLAGSNWEINFGSKNTG